MSEHEAITLLRRPTTITGGALSFQFDALVSEAPTDEAEVTKHPVESGGEISDHIQIKPVTLTLSGIIAGHDERLVLDAGRQQRLYNDLLTILRQRELVTVVTPLRRYPNMVLTRVGLTRDLSSGTSLRPELALEQVQVAHQAIVPVPESSLGPRAKRSGTSKKDKGDQPSDKAADDSADKAKADEAAKKTTGGGDDGLSSTLYDKAYGGG